MFELSLTLIVNDKVTLDVHYTVNMFIPKELISLVDLWTCM